MKSNKLDQFYTNPKIVDEILKDFFGCFYFVRTNIKKYTFIEPSAGTGNFLDGLFKWNVSSKQIKAYDIEPKNNSLIKDKNFLDINFKRTKLDKKTTITIGNPPFGKKGDLALKFLNKSLEHSAIVAFILPNTFRRYLTQSKVSSSAKLVFDKTLNPNSFLVGNREYNVNCCFQIWVNSEIKVSVSDLRLKKQIKALSNDVELFIHNNTKETLKYFNKSKYKWDFAIHRQGYYDYNKKIINPNNLVQNRQYLFVKCKNKNIMKYINKIDFNKLAKENSTTILGFSNSDFYNELYKLIIEEQLFQETFF